MRSELKEKSHKTGLFAKLLFRKPDKLFFCYKMTAASESNINKSLNDEAGKIMNVSLR